jgi:iron complex transport system substrate-binding protein
MPLGAAAFQSSWTVTRGGLPADSGATVPDSHRLPAHASSRPVFARGCRETLVARSRAGPGVSLGVNFRALASLAAVALASCGPPRTYATEVRNLAQPPPRRIVSLVPSLTEDLFAVGAGASVVGVSQYTDYPAQAKRLPQVASFASINAERVVALHADLAIGIPAQDRLAGDLRRAGVPVELMRDDTFPDIFADLARVGDLTGHAAQARAAIARLRARTDALVRSVKPRARRPSVFVVLGVAPVYTVGRGSYIATLIAMAGGRNAAGDVRAPYARYSAESLVARQPDLLIVDPDVRLSDVLGQPPWNALRAVKERRVFTLPDAAILERPGPRYNDGLAWLIGVIAR